MSKWFSGMLLNVWLSNLTLAALPVDDRIRDKAAEITSRDLFRLDEEKGAESLGLLLRLLMWLLTPFRWLFEAMEGIPDFLRWIIVAGLMLLLIALVVHIVWTFVSALSGIPKRGLKPGRRQKPLTPQEMESAAELAYQSGDYIGAIRHLFVASLLHIQLVEDRPFRKGITNREILKKYRQTRLFEPLKSFVQTIDTKWYGHDVCVEEDYLECRQKHSVIRELVERRKNAIAT